MSNTSTDKRYCNSCNEHVFTIMQTLYSGPHYAQETCAQCGKFVAFSKKPENKGRRAKNKYKPEDLKVDYCQMCFRPGDRLGSRGTLEVHHIVEVNSGGADEPQNIWVLCTSCHRLVHHQRTYLNLHLKCMYTTKELRADMDKYNVPQSVRGIMERLFEQQEVNNA